VSDRQVLLSSNTTATLSSSGEETRKSLLSAINHLSERDSNTFRARPSGDYITKVMTRDGEVRVVWRLEDDRIIVLTVFGPSEFRG
jgi:mRNA-degrading endonuclease RelE of RelBE toxin-antitoxin system